MKTYRSAPFIMIVVLGVLLTLASSNAMFTIAQESQPLTNKQTPKSLGVLNVIETTPNISGVTKPMNFVSAVEVTSDSESSWQVEEMVTLSSYSYPLDIAVDHNGFGIRCMG